MLRWRLTLGALFIAGLAGLIAWDMRCERPGSVLFPLVIILTLLVTQETLALLARRGLDAWRLGSFWGNTCLVLSVPIAHWCAARPVNLDPVAGALGFWFTVAMVRTLWRYVPGGGALHELAATALVLLYAGFLPACLVTLRLTGPGQRGLWLLAAQVLIVKSGDTGAYTAGRLWGRHKMSPVLSPGKTWEGAAGGLAAAALGSWLALVWPMPAWFGVDVSGARGGAWLAAGVILAIAGIWGDLAESLLKREAGCKDSSSWMPGFGGVLDLLDSLLFTAPWVYLIGESGWVG